MAAGYLGVSECGLFWQGACHLSLSVPCQVTSHHWPPLLQNVPQMAESRQGTFEKYQPLYVEDMEEWPELAVLGKLASQEYDHQCPARLFI